ncbi:MAG TPA: hypothetical protein VF427_14145 [Noviherbaspirillum sp.]
MAIFLRIAFPAGMFKAAHSHKRNSCSKKIPQSIINRNFIFFLLTKKACHASRMRHTWGALGNEMRIKKRVFLRHAALQIRAIAMAIVAVRAWLGTKIHRFYLRIPLPNDPLDGWRYLASS